MGYDNGGVLYCCWCCSHPYQARLWILIFLSGKQKNNNNNNIGRFPGGGLENQNPARTIAHSPPGVKETLNYMLRGKKHINIYTYIYIYTSAVPAIFLAEIQFFVFASNSRSSFILLLGHTFGFRGHAQLRDFGIYKSKQTKTMFESLCPVFIVFSSFWMSHAFVRVFNIFAFSLNI